MCKKIVDNGISGTPAFFSLPDYIETQACIASLVFFAISDFECLVEILSTCAFRQVLANSINGILKLKNPKSYDSIQES